MTLTELISELRTHAPETPVTFATAGRALAPGFHVTELKLAQVSSIDCGGVQDAWHETRLQLMDGFGGIPMPASKLITILTRSAAAIAGLDAQDCQVEFAEDSAGLGLYAMQGITAGAQGLTIALTPLAPECKVISRISAQAATSCCAPA